MLRLGSIGMSFMYNLVTGNGEDNDTENNNDTLGTNANRLRALRATLEKHGGLFSKVAQMLSYSDKSSSVFSECKPFSSEKTLSFLKEYMKNTSPLYSIDYDIYKSGSIGQVHIGKLEDGIYNAWNSKFANELREMHRCGKYYENPTCKKCVEGTSSSN